MNYIELYYQEIKSKKKVVSNKVSKIYAKLINEINNPGKWHFDNTLANRPIDFIENFCKHSKGELAGQKIKLELFQKAYISALFGFVDNQGMRRFKESMLLVGRKNGKSTLLSGIALYMMIADHEPGAEVYAVASKKDQAKLVFESAWNMIKQSPYLNKHIKKRKSDLYFPCNFSKFMYLGRNSDTLDGLNSSAVILDELHSIKDRNVYEVMKQSMSSRRQPLLIMITTSGTVRECIFDDMYSYASKIVDGTFVDDSFLPVLYELDNKEEWQNPNCWLKSNPGLGTIKKLEDLEIKVKRAIQDPKTLAGLLCKDFNIKTTTSKAWLNFDDLNNNNKFSLLDFKNSYAIGGADLSITTDLTCATILIIGENNTRYVHQMYWLPKDNFNQRVSYEKIPYDKWLERGLLRLCEGNSINYSDITAWFLELVNKYNITPLWIYYDSYSAKYWVNEMQEQGFNMVRCIQGFKTLSLPMQQLECDLKAKLINYNDNPILKWCMTNVGLETDRNGNYMPKKALTPKMRIDGFSSLLDAYTGLMEHMEEYKRSL